MSNFTSPVLIDGVDVMTMLLGKAPVRGLLPGGQAWYVCNRSGLPSGDGVSADQPLAALFGANGALKRLANRVNYGDCIYVLPGHVESVSAADMASHTGTAAGFSVVGIGTGTMRPVFNWTVATSTWLLDTANVEIANCILNFAGDPALTAALTVAAPITVSAAGCRVVNNYITFGVDADQIVTIGITTTAAADNFEFMGNYCVGATGAVCTTFLRLVGSDNSVIRGNYIRGETSVATVGVIQCLTTASLNLQLVGNFIANMKSDASIAFTPMAATTGIAAWNYFYIDGAGILPITAGLMEWFDNKVVNDQGEAGALVGTASA